MIINQDSTHNLQVRPEEVRPLSSDTLSVDQNPEVVPQIAPQIAIEQLISTEEQTITQTDRGIVPGPLVDPLLLYLMWQRVDIIDFILLLCLLST